MAEEEEEVGDVSLKEEAFFNLFSDGGCGDGEPTIVDSAAV